MIVVLGINARASEPSGFIPAVSAKTTNSGLRRKLILAGSGCGDALVRNKSLLKSGRVFRSERAMRDVKCAFTRTPQG